MLVRALPGLLHGPLAAFARRVPEQFVALDTYADGASIHVIACPCGEEPTVMEGRCTECACERFYLSAGGSILVANSPRDRDAS